MDGVACDHDQGCITCGDIALPLTVLELRGDGMALCADADGAHEEVDVSLIEEAKKGDTVLVHARVALTRVEA